MLFCHFLFHFEYFLHLFSVFFASLLSNQRNVSAVKSHAWWKKDDVQWRWRSWGCFGRWILALFIIPSQMGSRRLPGYIFCLVFSTKKATRPHTLFQEFLHMFLCCVHGALYPFSFNPNCPIGGFLHSVRYEEPVVHHEPQPDLTDRHDRFILATAPPPPLLRWGTKECRERGKDVEEKKMI